MKHMKRMKKKSLLLVAGIVLMLTIAIGGTIAYIVTDTVPITNTFEPGKVPITIGENTFDGKTKSNVYVINKGNVSAYIRAKIIVTWKNAQGEVSGTPVTASDYNMVINNTDWTKVGDFYYYNESVEERGTTGYLIISCKKTDTATPPEDYNLSVEIIAESIQADGMDGVSNAQQAFAKANGNQ